jgi:hypothetical protein
VATKLDGSDSSSQVLVVVHLRYEHRLSILEVKVGMPDEPSGNFQPEVYPEQTCVFRSSNQVNELVALKHACLDYKVGQITSLSPCRTYGTEGKGFLWEPKVHMSQAWADPPNVYEQSVGMAQPIYDPNPPCFSLIIE